MILAFLLSLLNELWLRNIYRYLDIVIKCYFQCFFLIVEILESIDKIFDQTKFDNFYIFVKTARLYHEFLITNCIYNFSQV